MPMRLLVTKACRLTSGNHRKDAIAMAQQAMRRYASQRYRDPATMDNTPWKKNAIDENTTLFSFSGSDILIAEKWSSAPAESLEELKAFATALDHDIDALLRTQNQDASPLWASYWLVLSPEHRRTYQTEIRSWLADSIKPEDADLIIDGKLDASMTWLRYVAIDNQTLQNNIRSMRIAQYYYAEFDQINSHLFDLIGKLSQHKVPGMNEVATLRRALDMKRLQLREDLRLLPRRIKHSVEDILEHWEFQQLDDSVDRLQEVCTNLIANHWDQKAGLSRVASEVILVAIGLFGFLNLMISWAIFSRQVATNPIMLLDEAVLPSTARVVASMPMDTLVLMSLSLGLVILAIYIVFRRGYR